MMWINGDGGGGRDGIRTCLQVQRSTGERLSHTQQAAVPGKQVFPLLSPYLMYGCMLLKLMDYGDFPLPLLSSSPGRVEEERVLQSTLYHLFDFALPGCDQARLLIALPSIMIQNPTASRSLLPYQTCFLQSFVAQQP
jgi:hypothetical protein